MFHYYQAGLRTTTKKLFCTPVSATIQSGVDVIRKWEDETHEAVSHVVQMAKDAVNATKTFGEFMRKSIFRMFYKPAPVFILRLLFDKQLLFPDSQDDFIA